MEFFLWQCPVIEGQYSTEYMEYFETNSLRKVKEVAITPHRGKNGLI